jgi:hypothetical protein
MTTKSLCAGSGRLVGRDEFLAVVTKGWLASTGVLVVCPACERRVGLTDITGERRVKRHFRKEGGA